MNSTELIQRAKDRFKDLEHKGYEWRSFYNGFLEAYGVAVGEFKNCNLPVVTNRTLSEKKPIRYKCLLCGRDKFTRKSPHNCIGGFRKRNIKWLPIFE